MARRFSRKASRAAAWSSRLIRFVAVVVLITALGRQFDLIDTPSALALVALCWLGATISLLLGASALRSIWRLGMSGTRQALTGVVVSVPMLAVPIYCVFLVVEHPNLSDVTTDTRNPPALKAAAALRPAGANPIAYPGAAAAQIQLAAYPELRSLRVGVGVEEAFDAVRAVVNARGWRVVAERLPSDNDPSGLIEAVARTLLIGFEDDVAIRVLQDIGGARVDIRSASRYGSHDLGTNVRRIRAFLFALREEISPTAGGER